MSKKITIYHSPDADDAFMFHGLVSNHLNTPGYEFVSELKSRDVMISMDHKGRCFDNILVERLWRTLKQEVIYYYRPEDVITLERCLEEFVPWYNNQRLHQSLKYKTPASVYFAG